MNRVGDIITYVSPGFRPRQFRITKAGPLKYGTQEFSMQPLDGLPTWEREDSWQRLAREIGERYLRESRSFRKANMTTESDQEHNGGWTLLELPSLFCLPDLPEE